jgi:hypothetical protein
VVITDYNFSFVSTILASFAESAINDILVDLNRISDCKSRGVDL